MVFLTTVSLFQTQYFKIRLCQELYRVELHVRFYKSLSYFAFRWVMWKYDSCDYRSYDKHRFWKHDLFLIRLDVYSLLN